MEAPIGDHALIGDTRSAALVSPAGAIDWWCLPTFDSDPIFGQLVGGAAAGTFSIGPSHATPPIARRYRPDSTVVETCWHTLNAELTLTEGMVANVEHDFLPDHLLVRRVDVRGGSARIRIRFDPRRGRRHQPPTVRRVSGAMICSWPGLAAAITSTVGPIPVGSTHEIDVGPDAPLIVAVSVSAAAPAIVAAPERAWTALLQDERSWQAWAQSCRVDGSLRDAAVRSLLTLRLLTYSPSGAPVAAPTTSLPELIGGARNWDYRFTWPRDAAITAAALLRVGHVDEASRFVAWLLHTTALDRPRLRAVYTLHGGPPRREVEWPQWPGHRDSKPVRIGNDARSQHQLDGYGWLMDAASILDEEAPLFRSTWRAIAKFADFAVIHWREPDQGIWEVRAPAAHHVHSKLMAWLAIDRALALARRHRTRSSRVRRWKAARVDLAAEVRHHGFDTRRETYVRTYGSSDLDAALLLLPVLGFEESSSPRVRGTIDAIRRELDAGFPLIYRYPPGTDGLEGGEGAFLACSFWLVQALARTRQLDAANELLEALIPLGGPLGLYAEEMDPSSGDHLGNFPQALTHAALLQAVFALQDATDREARQGSGRTRHARRP